MDKAREIKPKGLFVREDFSEGVCMARSKMSDMLSTFFVFWKQNMWDLRNIS